MTTRITVIMSVYNGERSVRKAILSILNQTFRHFEFIIVDDCSTDKTCEIIEEYVAKDKRILLLKNFTNIGLTKSLNKAIEKSKTSFIVRQDADDWSNKQRLQKQFNYLKYHKLDLCGCGGETRPVSDLIKSNIFTHGSLMFRKKLGLYNPYFKYCQDYEFTLRAYVNGFKLCNMPDKLYNSGVRKDNISHTKMYEQCLYRTFAKLINTDIPGKELIADLLRYCVWRHIK